MGVLTHSATTRIAVTVTFLKQTRPCSDPAQPLPANTTLVRLPHPTASFYRYLYDTVGGPYVWWLRRTLPVGELRALLAMPGVSVHVLYRDQEPAGFFELDHQSSAVVNLSYFGLLPHAVGTGLGTPLLRAALDIAWSHHPKAVTVNTCTADHPRAMPTYLRQGFTPVRTVREIWDVPDRLGIKIPDHLKI